MASGYLQGGFRVPPPYRLATNTPQGGLRVASGGFDSDCIIQHSSFSLPFSVALGGIGSDFFILHSTFYLRLHVALRGLARLLEVRSSEFDVRRSVFTIRVLNTTPLSRLPRGGLGAPWYHPGPVLYP